MRWFAGRGCAVVGIDRDAQALAVATAWGTGVQADIENGLWPLPAANHPGVPESFGAVIVTNYLWRPLLGQIGRCLAPGGVLIYETFASGNETVGKPSRPDFLLQPGELLAAFGHLRVIAYEDGFLPSPERFVQRIVAIAPPDSRVHDESTGETAKPALPCRYSLATNQ